MRLDKGEVVVDEHRPMRQHSVDWTPYIGNDWDVEYDYKVQRKR